MYRRSTKNKKKRHALTEPPHAQNTKTADSQATAPASPVLEPLCCGGVGGVTRTRTPGLRHKRLHFDALLASLPSSPDAKSAPRKPRPAPLRRAAPAAARHAPPPPDAGAPGPGAARALLVRRPWVDLLLDGSKTWEIRGAATSLRGRVALACSGTGLILGGASLVACHGPLSAAQLESAAHLHRVPVGAHPAGKRYKRVFAWEFAAAERLATPRRYKHPQGAVIWVRLPVPVLC